MNYKSEWVCETTKGVILKGVVLKGLILRGIIFSRIALRTLLLNKLLLLAVLVSCGGESPRAKPQQITVFANPIVGTAALGLVSNARVDAYLIATESQAQQHKECSTDNKNKIGSGTTDDNGYFNLTLNLDSGYVLFVLSGGSYIEEATNQKVYLTNNQKLYATHHYHSGEIKEQGKEIENIVISPWSHLMTGMFCYMMGSSARSPAISPANSMINTSSFITNWLGFDPRYVNYKDPTDNKNNRADLIFDEGVKLGFLNSAISELTKEWSVTDEATTHATINSIYLAQLMYEDINNDGVLDGRGAKGPLHIVRKVSNIPLNAATYRLSIPQQMLHFFDNNDNNQIKDNGRGILYLLADGINSNEHPQVFQQQSPPLDMLAPQVEWLAPNTKRLTGVVNISLRVKDFSGVQQVTFYAASSRAASQNRVQAIDDIYTFIVDTRPDGSGDFDYRVTTMDILGNQQTINFPVTLINEAPIIEIIAPDINNRGNNAGTTATTNESAYLLEARFSKIVPSQSIADAACSLNDEQNFDVVINKEESIASCAVLLPHNGIHHIEMKLCDDNNLCNTRGHNVLFDDEPPVITPINEQESYYRNVSVSFMISDTTSNIIQPVTWTASGNGETMNGVAQQLPTEGTYQVLFDAARFGNNPVRLTIKARDSLKNMATRSQTYQVFNQPPTILLVSTPKFKQNSYNAIFEVEENSYTNIRVACRLATSVSFQSWDYQTTQSGNQQSEQTLTLRGECATASSEIQDGNHTLEIRICGDYNLCVIQPIIVTKDTAAPMIRIINLQDEYDGAGGQIILEITDELSIVTSATFSIDDNEAQDITKRASDWTFALPLNLNTGRHKLTIVTVDEIGNAHTMHYNFLTLREEPAISRVSTLYTDSNLYRLAAQLDPGSYQGDYQAQCILAEQSIAASISRNRINCQLDTQGLNDGEHQVEIILATDYGKSYTRTLAVTKDTTMPMVRTINLQDEYDGAGGQIILEITDEFSMVTSATFTINDNEAQDITKRASDWTFALPLNLNTGKHQLAIVAVDALGNTNTIQRDFLTLREEPIISRTSSLYTDSDLYRLAAQLNSGSYQGAYQAQCILAEQSVVASILRNRINCSLDTQGLNDGEHQVEIILATDYDKSYTREISFIKDTTPPQINILDLLATYTSPVPASLQVYIDDALSPTTRATYRINGGAIILLEDTGARRIITLPINELPTGRHTLTIQATDFVGNPNAMTRNFIVEKDAPIVTQTSAHATNQGIYNLVATLDKGSYQGDYNAECQLSNQVLPAIINGNTLRCLLDISSSSDGSHDIRVTLTADYGKSYTRTLTITKDTAPPQIVAIEHQQAYSAKPFALRYQVNDLLSDIASVTYLYGDNIQGLSARPIGNNLWEVDINPNLLLSGEHNMRVIASDALSNSLQINSPILIIKHPPQVTLAHQNISNQDTLDISGKIILASPEASVASITCSFLRNPTGAVHREINGEINGNNFICRSLPIVGLNNELVEVEICDIFANCAIYPTFVTHDNSPPILSSVTMPNMVNVYSCGEKNRYDDIPPNCPITQSPAANIYSISEQAQDLQKTNPPLIVVQQEEILLNNESLVIDNFADGMQNNGLMVSEIKINRAELDRQGIIFAGINVHDNELSPSRYFTDPYDLNITYSYTQIDCPEDDTGNQNLVCSQNNKKVYFTRKSIPEAAINLNTDSSDAEITIPFSNEFLSSANNPLWYNSPPRIIHRLDIFVCDEAGNCVEYVTRFRVTVLAAAPIVAFNSNNNFRNDFQRHDNLRYLFSVIQRNVRTWRISNPSPTDIWVRVKQSPANIQYFAEMWIMRKINKYSTHRHRQFLRKVGRCGNWFSSSNRYVSVTEYTTETKNHYSSTPNPRGLRFAAPHSSEYKLSCDSTGPRIDEVRYEQISGYPRQKFNRASSSNKRINFAMTLNRHLVNLAKGTKTPALEYNGWMLLPAGNYLVLTTDEKMTNDPGYYQPIMIYDTWRDIDRYRNVTIPASIGLSYTRSHVDSVSPSLSSVRSRIYQIPQVTVNNRRAIHCARADGEPAC